MTKISKLEAAGTQLDMAIELLFTHREFVPIHTLLMASFGVLKNLSEKQGKKNALQAFRERIKPEFEKQFWEKVNEASNFFKHADRDPESLLSIPKESVNDYMIFISTATYIDLGGKQSVEIRAFNAWMTTMHPEMLLKDCPTRDKFFEFHNETGIKDRSRREQLALGWEFIKTGRSLKDQGHDPSI